MRLTIYLPEDGTRERLEAAAARAGESLSEYLRRAAAEREARERKERAA